MKKRDMLWGAALIAAVLVSPIAAQPAERPWQDFQDLTAQAVQARWASPPSEYGPEPYYALAPTIEGIRADFDRMKAYGYRAVTVQYAGKAPFEYLSPEYFAYFRQVIDEAKARDLRLWIVDDVGYPSGFSAGKFTAERPDLRMQTLSAAQRWPVAGGASLDEAAPEGVVSVTAIDATGAAVQVPVSAGRVRWTAPAGQWTVIAVAHGFDTSPTRSDLNPTRAKDKTYSLEDYLNPEATAQYIAFTHDAYRRAVGDAFGTTILGFRGDEPDYSVAGLPWTPRFFERFEKEKGYDVRPYLASFLQGRGARLTEEQTRARADYADVFSLMFEDGFYKPLGEWAAANGVEYQIHLNHEERLMELARSEGDLFRDLRHLQVPGVDAIWHQIWTDTVSDFPRLVSSAAHVYGHPRAMTESFAAYRPAPDITVARYVVNQQMVRGVNLVEMMFWSGGGRGGSPFMQDPAFPALTAYTSRLSYLMSMGRPAAQVAVLAPRSALYLNNEEADAMFVSTERLLSEHQIDFDVVDDDAVGSVMKAGPGTFESLSGNRYRTVIVPAPDFLPAKVVERLRAFAAAGGKVLFLGHAPKGVIGESYRTTREAKAADFSWATIQPGELGVTPTPPAQAPAAAPGPLNAPAEIVAAVQKAVGKDDLALAAPNLGLRYTHRRLKDATVYMLFNEQADAVTNRVSLKADGRRIEVWDPQTGAVTPAAGVAVTAGRLEVPVTLDGYASRVLVVR
jgi:hypothetical protein